MTQHALRRRRGWWLALALTALMAEKATAQEDFADCIDAIRMAAVREGVSPGTAETLLTGVTPSERVIELDRRQPEFTSTLAGYLQRRVSDARIEQGRAMLVEHAGLLRRITREYGVPGRYIVAFWGLETNYGQFVGDMSTIRSLATLACDRRRGAFFRGELIAALQLADRGTVPPERLRGSWAGALGNFQFLPSVYRDHAVDADGDGRPDLWNSFEDAAVSAAAFLQARGWQAGERWGREVQLPADFDLALLAHRQSLADWSRAGVRRADGTALPDADLDGRLLLPAGVRGPAFLVYDNFDVIMRWNPSRFYALSVGLLADRLIGAPPLAVSPPADEPLAIAAVRVMQERLNRLGHEAGKPDGRIGPQTRAALQSFQRRVDLPPDGYPDPDTLARLEEVAAQN